MKILTLFMHIYTHDKFYPIRFTHPQCKATYFSFLSQFAPTLPLGRVESHGFNLFYFLKSYVTTLSINIHTYLLTYLLTYLRIP